MSDIVPFESKPPAFLNGLQDDITSSLKLSGNVPPRVSLAGGMITTRIGKDVEHNFGPEAKVAIIGAMPTAGRLFYEKQFSPGADDNEPPVCWSEDGEKPSKAAEKPQSAMCATCPKNVAGSAPNGRGKACAMFRNLAIVFLDDEQLRVYRFTAKWLTMAGKDDTANQRFNLNNLARFAEQYNTPIGALALLMQVDPSMGVPGKVVFKPLGYLPEHIIARLYDAEQSQLAGKLVLRDEVQAQVDEVIRVDFEEAWAALKQRDVDLDQSVANGDTGGASAGAPPFGQAPSILNSIGAAPDEKAEEKPEKKPKAAPKQRKRKTKKDPEPKPAPEPVSAAEAVTEDLVAEMDDDSAEEVVVSMDDLEGKLKAGLRSVLDDISEEIADLGVSDD